MSPETPTIPAVERPGPPPVDPRIEQRRSEVQRADARRRLRIVAGVAALLALAGGAWGLTRSPLLDVDRVRVLGAHHVTADQVLVAARLANGGFMTDVDERSAARRIERLPWVARATVRRRWPRTVVVTMAERVPAASIRDSEGNWVLVDRTGRALAAAPVPSPGRPVLEGALEVGRPGSRLDAIGRAALAVAASLRSPLASEVTAVFVQPGGEVELRLKGAVVVRVGLPERIPEKLLATETLLARGDRRDLAVLDVRAPASPVIVRQAAPLAAKP